MRRYTFEYEIAMNVVSAREAFRGTPEIQVKSSAPGWTCLHIAPELSLKDRVVGFFRSQLLNDLSPELCEQITLAMDELLGNALEHGCNTEPKLGVELAYIRTNRSLLFHLRDAGPGFSLDSLDHAALNNPPEDPLRHASFRSEMGLRPGGYGIMLVKKIADELIYNETGNEVLFIKYL
jgi:two-component system, OmpR family, response regulator